MNLFSIVSFFLFGMSHPWRSRQVTIAWSAGAKRNERREPTCHFLLQPRFLGISFAVTTIRIRISGVRGNARALPSNRRNVRKRGGNWYLSSFLFAATSKPYVDLRRAVAVLAPVESATSRSKEKKISFTPPRGVAVLDKIAACLYMWRGVKAILHGPLLTILVWWFIQAECIRREEFLFRASVGIIRGSNWGFP